MKKQLITLFGIMLTINLYALEVGQTAPCVTLEGLDAAGNPVEGCIRDQVDTNHTHTLLEFFSITCKTCNKNLPNLNRLTKAIEDKVTVRIVTLNENVEEVKAYLKKPEIAAFVNFHTAFDPDLKAKDSYGVSKTPTHFILNKQNEVIYKHLGLLAERDIEDIKALVH